MAKLASGGSASHQRLGHRSAPSKAPTPTDSLPQDTDSQDKEREDTAIDDTSETEDKNPRRDSAQSQAGDSAQSQAGDSAQEHPAPANLVEGEDDENDAAPAQNHLAQDNLAEEEEDEEEEDEEEEEETRTYPIRGIIAKKGDQYKVVWQTAEDGTVWDPTWEPEGNIDASVVRAYNQDMQGQGNSNTYEITGILKETATRYRVAWSTGDAPSWVYKCDVSGSAYLAWERKKARDRRKKKKKSRKAKKQ